jgi:hypothetical protein
VGPATGSTQLNQLPAPSRLNVVLVRTR